MPFKTAKSPFWQYDIQVKGSRFRGSCETEDFEEAKAVEADIRANARRQNSLGQTCTLSEALGTYLRDKASGTPSEATTKSQATAILKHIDGKTRLDKLQNSTIQKYVSADRATCQNGTVNRRLQMLGRALKHVSKVYGVEVADLDLRSAETKEPRERVRELSQDEQTALFQSLPHEYHAFVSFALMTGARIETISNLEWRDIDLENREMTFRLKGDDMMLFPINRELAALLSSLPRSNVVSQRKYVFTRVNQQTAERVQIGSNGGVFGTVWRAALADAGISDYRFHDNRHTFATRLLRQTQNLKLVSKLLGHKKIETTMRYAHVMIDDMRDAMDDFSLHSTTPKSIDPQNKPQTKVR